MRIIFAFCVLLVCPGLGHADRSVNAVDGGKPAIIHQGIYHGIHQGQDGFAIRRAVIRVSGAAALAGRWGVDPAGRAHPHHPKKP